MSLPMKNSFIERKEGKGEEEKVLRIQGRLDFLS